MRLLSTGVHVALLITDVGLRGGANGKQLVDMVRGKTSDLPVIFITGFAGTESLSSENVISKPFQTGVLVDLIKDLITKASKV